MRRGVFVGGLLLCTLVACVLRFSRLTTRELWLDEVCTFYCVKHWDAWPADGPDKEREVTHRVYYFLLRGWTSLVGQDAWGLRSFSAAVGVLGVAALGLVAAGWMGRGAGLIAAGLAAVHPLHVHYSQEARGYALWCLVVTLLLHALFRAATTLRWRWWAAYAVAAWIAIGVHDYSVFLLPATILASLLAVDRKRFALHWAGATAAVGILIAPMMWSFLQSQVGGGSKAWIAREWDSYPPALAIARSLWAMLPSGGYPRYLGPLAAVTGYGSVVLAFGLLIAAAIRHRAAKNPKLRAGAVGMLVSLGFLMTAWLFSATVYPSYVVARYDLAAWPGILLGLVALILAVGGAMMRRGVRMFVTVAITAAFALGSISALRTVRSAPASLDLSQRARLMTAMVGDDDLLISVAMYKWFLLYEWDQVGFSPKAVSFPPAHDRQLGWEDGATELRNPREIEKGVAAIVAAAETTIDRGDRVWLIAQGKPEGPRWEVDQRLFAGLAAKGLEVTPVDEWLGLAKVDRVNR